MSLQDRIQEDLQDAMRQHQRARVGVLRLLKAAIHDAEIDQQRPLDEAGVLAVMAKAARQRRESIEAYSQGKRADLVAAEEFELQVIESYLPRQLSEEEVRAAVSQAIVELGAQGMTDMGRVMKHLTAQLRGQADGQRISIMVREALSGPAR